jgi:hypothetical protein
MKTEKAKLTQDHLKSLLNYDPDTGEFTWLVTRGKATVGANAGAVNTHGYLQMCINQKLYRCHRLAWLYVYGEFPEKGIDHINGIKTDNRISNLRQANQAENMQNMSICKSNKSGFLGVYFDKDRKKYRARIGIARKEKYLGLYDTAELAFEAYKEAKRKLHSFNPEVPLKSQK